MGQLRSLVLVLRMVLVLHKVLELVLHKVLELVLHKVLELHRSKLPGLHHRCKPSCEHANVPIVLLALEQVHMHCRKLVREQGLGHSKKQQHRCNPCCGQKCQPKR